MKIALAFTLAGTYVRCKDPSRVASMRVRVEASSGDVADLLRRDVAIAGSVDAEGLATSQRLEGKISIRPEERTTRYVFRFSTDEGRTLRFFGAQDFLWVDAWGSLFRVEGTAYDAADVEVLSAMLAFSPRRDLPRVLRSLSLRG